MQRCIIQRPTEDIATRRHQEPTAEPTECSRNPPLRSTGKTHRPRAPLFENGPQSTGRLAPPQDEKQKTTGSWREPGAETLSE